MEKENNINQITLIKWLVLFMVMLVIMAAPAIMVMVMSAFFRRLDK